MRPKKKAAKRNPPRSRRNTCLGLVVIDDQPIRKAALEEYHRIEKQLGHARIQIEAFESADLPAYERWEARALGPLLTTLRDTVQTLEGKRRLLGAIEDEMYWSGCSRQTAYRRVTQAEKAPPAEDEPEMEEETPKNAGAEKASSHRDASGKRVFGKSYFPPGFDIDDFDRSHPRVQADFRSFYEMMAELFEEMTGERAIGFEEALRQERARRGGAAGEPPPEGGRRTGTGGRQRSAQTNGSSTAQHQDDRLKELYRKLVRQLHPDHNHALTARERELWHQVQEAYRERDIERLEAISGQLEIGLDGRAGHLPVQILMRMARDLREALRSVQRQVNIARRHPGWDFRKKAASLRAFEAKRRRQLEHMVQETRAELAELTRILDGLAAKATRVNKKPRRTRVRAYSNYEQSSFGF